MKDLQESVRFYGYLGVKLKEIGASGHFEGQTQSGVRLMLDSVELMKKINSLWQEPQGVAIVLCFKQASPQAVDELFTQLVQAGYQGGAQPWDAFWGQRYGSVYDPDGNQIDLFAEL